MTCFHKKAKLDAALKQLDTPPKRHTDPPPAEPPAGQRTARPVPTGRGPKAAQRRRTTGCGHRSRSSRAPAAHRGAGPGRAAAPPLTGALLMPRSAPTGAGGPRPGPRPAPRPERGAAAGGGPGREQKTGGGRRGRGCPPWVAKEPCTPFPLGDPTGARGDLKTNK